MFPPTPQLIRVTCGAAPKVLNRATVTVTAPPEPEHRSGDAISSPERKLIKLPEQRLEGKPSLAVLQLIHNFPANHGQHTSHRWKLIERDREDVLRPNR
jgi:hypothetical protein